MANPKEIIEKRFIDYVVVDEGEISLLEIVSNKNPSQIKGIFYKKIIRLNQLKKENKLKI